MGNLQIGNSNTFKKLADCAVDRVAELNDPYAGWLFTLILRHIDRRVNKLVATFEQLADWAGMSTKSIERKTALLEAIGVIQIIRRKRGDKNAPNEYQLAGVAYEVACASQSRGEQTESRIAPSQSRSLTESEKIHHNDDDEKTLSSSGEFSIDEKEGYDSSTREQDSYQPQREYLEAMGVQGKGQIRRFSRIPLERIERAFAIAGHKAQSNPVGMALAILENGVFPDNRGGYSAEKSFVAGLQKEGKNLSWGDFAVE